MHVYTAAQNLFLLAVFMFAETVLLNQLARGMQCKEYLACITQKLFLRGLQQM